MDNKPARPARKVPKKISKTYLENAALYYLERYATSAENLRRVLTRKVKRSCAHHGDNPEDFLPLIGALVQRYGEAGLIDDKTYARGRVAALRRQGLAAQAILARLRMKGLTAAQVEQALAEVDAEAEDPELAAALAYAKRKKLGAWRTRENNPQKDLAALGRAGFSYEVAVKALKGGEE